MKNIHDVGGPAFPVPDKLLMGMSLRDYMAAHALIGLLAGRPDRDCGPEGYAADAYQYADAMLLARRGEP